MCTHRPGAILARLGLDGPGVDAQLDRGNPPKARAHEAEHADIRELDPDETDVRRSVVPGRHEAVRKERGHPVRSHPVAHDHAVPGRGLEDAGGRRRRRHCRLGPGFFVPLVVGVPLHR